MTAASARPTPADVEAARPARRLRTVDYQNRGKRYRIREDVRELGASVRPMERRTIACSRCDRSIRQYASYVQTPTLNVHPWCAIRDGLLVELPQREVNV